MDFNFRQWSDKKYQYIIILLIAGLIVSSIFIIDLRIIGLFIFFMISFSWLYLNKKDWDYLALRIKNYFKNYKVKVTYSILGGTTFLDEPAIPFTKKYLRPSLGASFIHKGVRIRINFLYFNPRLNPLILGSDYDFEVLLFDFDNDGLTNELYALGFKEKKLPENIKLLIKAQINTYYIRNYDYVKNPELFVSNLLNTINKHVK